ncbi:MAG: GNAT family N-acetyltransferase [Hyphomicrobiales bacterium]|uniref:GNAT family N-acetyltransferase n=1 Tax=Rhabdaerophilum calidifontis TaxID=2604328 RepID=UPI0012385B10|nr:GNAT family N-acetyltransferase [Rhabdaerophilum calidifontis]MCA1952540.1 GNAT family N-acetyltransferase [Hyphomicrobiales bacterium]MCA1999256.1 GNAT family N-acetyltransferase [Hyphomicrobiales bacterium]
MSASFKIKPGDFADPRVVALLERHYTENRAVTPAGSAHVLDLAAMQAPELAFFTLWEGEALLGMGALKRLADAAGEIKSMRTVDAARRRGVASAMLRHLIAEARAAGLARLYLETGSFEYFKPARALYARHGFVECAPFEGYRADHNSTFMMLDLP